jgi:hypothetical protein
MPSGDTEHETPPPLADFDPWKVGQPDDGIVWLYKSAVDGFWRVIKDEDIALQEATNYPVGELVDQEQRGNYEESESGELRAIYVPPANQDSNKQPGAEQFQIDLIPVGAVRDTRSLKQPRNMDRWMETP